MHKKLVTGAVTALAITSLGGLAVAAANTVSTTPAPASVSRFDDNPTRTEPRHEADDPANHDVGDDKGIDDPANHDVGDDKGIDDPATHDVGDDKRRDDPARHGTNDDKVGPTAPPPTTPRPTVVRPVVPPAAKPTTPATAPRPATSVPSHDAGDDDGGHRGSQTPTTTSGPSPSSGPGPSSSPSSDDRRGRGGSSDDSNDDRSDSHS